MPILPNWSPKNPLEVIAQFLLLIYGICALLLGFSVMKLSAPNQTTMVVFIVSFPVLVLAIFAWLVRNHHGKLYAPGDYRSDDAFLGKPANPSKLGEKLQTEAETEAETETETETEVGGAQAPMTPRFGGKWPPVPCKHQTNLGSVAIAY